MFITAERQLEGILQDPLLGWSGTLTGNVQQHTLPCFRQNMLDEPGANVLADILTECINEELQ